MMAFVFIALMAFTTSFFMSMMISIDQISIIEHDQNFAYSMLAVGDAAAQYSRDNPNVSGVIPESSYSPYYKRGFSGNQGKFFVQIDGSTGNIYVYTNSPSEQPKRHSDVIGKILNCSAMAGYVSSSKLVVPCNNFNSDASIPFPLPDKTLVYITHR